MITENNTLVANAYEKLGRLSALAYIANDKHHDVIEDCIGAIKSALAKLLEQAESGT